MARSIWNGAISFGMVTIPIKLYAATENKDVSFHLLHDKCNTRIKDLRWCPHCKKQVDWNEIVRGYEYTKGKYVKMTAEDFDHLPLPSKHTIEITSFVKSEEIEPVYYEKSYYMEPDEAAEKPFTLLMKTLIDEEMVAIGTVALRNKERLCALWPLGGNLMMDTLLYPDEIRVSSDKELPSIKLSKSELDMAHNLVNLMTKPFNPDEYHDRYREAVKKVIESKLEGEELVAEPEIEDKGKVINLMDALRNSVESARRVKTTSSTSNTRRKRRVQGKLLSKRKKVAR